MSAQKTGYVLKTIASLGYPGLFLGLVLEFLGVPFPGEIVLTFTGFLVWNGHLGFGVAVFSATMGSLTGTVAAYFLGRKFGRPLLDKYGKYVFVDKKKIDTAEHWFNRHRFLVLLFGRFVPGIRPLSAYTAGIAHMEFMQFWPLSVCGAFVWCAAFIFLGKHLGKNWASISSLLERYDLALVGVLAVGCLGYLVWKTLNRQRR